MTSSDRSVSSQALIVCQFRFAMQGKWNPGSSWLYPMFLYDHFPPASKLGQILMFSSSCTHSAHLFQRWCFQDVFFCPFPWRVLVLNNNSPYINRQSNQSIFIISPLSYSSLPPSLLCIVSFRWPFELDVTNMDNDKELEKLLAEDDGLKRSHSNRFQVCFLVFP